MKLYQFLRRNRLNLLLLGASRVAVRDFQGPASRLLSWLPYPDYGGSRGPDAGTSGSALFSSDGPIGERRVRDFVSVIEDTSVRGNKSIPSFDGLQSIICVHINMVSVEI